MAEPKYKAQPEYYKDNYIWSVFETATEQVVARFHFEQDSRRDAKKRNRGSVWCGWTPAFFLKPEIKVQ